MQHTTSKLAIGDLAPNGKLLDINNNSTNLFSLLNGEPTLLTFLRHFG